MKVAAIRIARNGQHAGSQWGTPPENRQSAENRRSNENRHSAENRHSTENHRSTENHHGAEKAAADSGTRSVGPAVPDWTETEAERNNDTEMEISGTDPPMMQ
jgi:hypothetical protein